MKFTVIAQKIAILLQQLLFATPSRLNVSIPGTKNNNNKYI